MDVNRMLLRGQYLREMVVKNSAGCAKNDRDKKGGEALHKSLRKSPSDTDPWPP